MIKHIKFQQQDTKTPHKIELSNIKYTKSY